MNRFNEDENNLIKDNEPDSLKELLFGLDEEYEEYLKQNKIDSNDFQSENIAENKKQRQPMTEEEKREMARLMRNGAMLIRPFIFAFLIYAVVAITINSINEANNPTDTVEKPRVISSSEAMTFKEGTVLEDGGVVTDYRFNEYIYSNDLDIKVPTYYLASEDTDIILSVLYKNDERYCKGTGVSQFTVDVHYKKVDQEYLNDWIKMLRDEGYEESYDSEDRLWYVKPVPGKTRFAGFAMYNSAKDIFSYGLLIGEYEKLFTNK